MNLHARRLYTGEALFMASPTPPKGPYDNHIDCYRFLIVGVEGNPLDTL